MLQTSTTLQTWSVPNVGGVATQTVSLALPSNATAPTVVATDLTSTHQFCITVPSALTSGSDVKFCSATFLLARK